VVPFTSESHSDLLIAFFTSSLPTILFLRAVPLLLFSPTRAARHFSLKELRPGRIEILAKLHLASSFLL